MKQVIFYFSILFIIILSAVSCSKDRHWIKGDGNDVTNIRNSQSFNQLSISISADVELIKDSVFRIELSGQQNVLDVIETNVRGNKLCIGLDNLTVLRKHNPIQIRVYAPNIEAIDLNGSSDVHCASNFSSSNMDIRVSGSGNVFFKGNVSESMNANISGSGGINLEGSGSCKSGKYTISGSGDIQAEWLKVDNLSCDISGSGSQHVYAVKTLNVTISGSGKVYYRGNPSINSNISGSGKIQSLQ